MSAVRAALDIFFHLDAHLAAWADWLGPWLYVVLFVIVFCKTGLVVTPFLPGNSLLFAVGALASVKHASVQLPVAMPLLIVAAVAGDAVNYAIGAYVGPKVFTSEESRLFNTRHLLRTQRFYERYGGKTVFLARFVPIVRTFAPFVAGIGRMAYRRFTVFNVSGAVAWVVPFLLGGYWFGNMPMVKRQFHYVILAIILISLVPIGVEYLWARRSAADSGSAP